MKNILLLLLFPLMGLIFLIGPSYATVQITPPSTEQSMLEDESVLHLNITYWNDTQAIVNGPILNFATSDEIVQFIQEKILEERDLEPTVEEEELEEQESDGGGGGGGSDNNESPPEEEQPNNGNGTEEEFEAEEEVSLEPEPEAEETNATMRIPNVTCMGPDIDDPCRAMPLLST